MPVSMNSGISARIAQRAYAAGSSALPKGEEPVVTRTRGRNASDDAVMLGGRRLTPDSVGGMVQPAVDSNRQAAASLNRLGAASQKPAAEAEAAPARVPLDREA